ncbi:hypothetical protein L2E82_23121 [Cichorium intybus]|uniref:Uncharacterized protein n=1 Tax=Cichorium intybus TaxID=13427 RepID=A0ACB9E0N7_CICIN|nr:hypothetical protein L2E82_23121 [Cichorium intybus]
MQLGLDNCTRALLAAVDTCACSPPLRKAIFPIYSYHVPVPMPISIHIFHLNILILSNPSRRYTAFIRRNLQNLFIAFVAFIRRNLQNLFIAFVAFIRHQLIALSPPSSLFFIYEVRWSCLWEWCRVSTMECFSSTFTHQSKLTSSLSMRFDVHVCGSEVGYPPWNAFLAIYTSNQTYQRGGGVLGQPEGWDVVRRESWLFWKYARGMTDFMIKLLLTLTIGWSIRSSLLYGIKIAQQYHYLTLITILSYKPVISSTTKAGRFPIFLSHEKE